MLKVVNTTDSIAAARLVELLADSTPWHRSLWGVGIGLSIKELLEACAAVQSGIINEPSIRRLGSSCTRIAGKDPALTPHERSTLNEELRTPPRLEGIGFFAIRELGERIERDYLLRWANVFQSNACHDPERAARSIATYLLDRRFSDVFLHQWFKTRLYVDPVDLTLADLCEEAHKDIAMKPPTTFDVLVAFTHSPRSASGYPKNWLKAIEVSQWLKSNDFSVSGVRASGGLILQAESMDAFAAVDLATSLVDRYVARAAIATGQVLDPWPSLWVRGHPHPFSYQAKHRGVRVKALYREDQIFSTPKDSNVDAAIDLLAHLENSSPSAAIAGGWAAIEALLGEPGDRASAADSLAALVACSVPRAELTFLSHALEKHCIDLAPSLHTCDNNRNRAAITAQVLTAVQQVNLPRIADQAAVKRMRELLRNPREHLIALQVSASDAFHRLYRQRNLILHGGINDSVALPASLRTASRIAGAGMDRVAHGFYVQGIRPLELAARARLALALVQPTDPSACVDLLGA